MRSSIFALAAALAVAAIPSAQPVAQLATMTPGPTQNPRFTSDQEAWRPVAHYDLALPTGEAEAYASIWQAASTRAIVSRHLPRSQARSRTPR